MHTALAKKFPSSVVSFKEIPDKDQLLLYGVIGSDTCPHGHGPITPLTHIITYRLRNVDPYTKQFAEISFQLGKNLTVNSLLSLAFQFQKRMYMRPCPANAQQWEVLCNQWECKWPVSFRETDIADVSKIEALPTGVNPSRADALPSVDLRSLGITPAQFLEFTQIATKLHVPLPDMNASWPCDLQPSSVSTSPTSPAGFVEEIPSSTPTLDPPVLPCPDRRVGNHTAPLASPASPCTALVVRTSNSKRRAVIVETVPDTEDSEAPSLDEPGVHRRK